jgi:hypothetical protein
MQRKDKADGDRKPRARPSAVSAPSPSTGIVVEPLVRGSRRAGKHPPEETGVPEKRPTPDV